MADPLADRPMRDSNGNELPDESGPSNLAPQQVDEALAALPGWEREGERLVRQIPVPRDSRDALQEGVWNVISDSSRIAMEGSGEQGLTIRLGAADGGLRPDDLETAARIDTVLSGSGTDHGTTN